MSSFIRQAFNTTLDVNELKLQCVAVRKLHDSEQAAAAETRHSSDKVKEWCSRACEMDGDS